MTHIAFVTLFLGLVLGPHPVEVKVTGPASRVELQVDGQVTYVAAKAPWNLFVDFGPRLLPHHLVVRALDENGDEIARAEQIVNMPRRTAEVQLVLERGPKDEPAGVQVLWQSLEADRPKKVALSLDAKPLDIDDSLHARLPRMDLSRPHLLRVRAVSPVGTVAESELAFGGGLETESGSHLTGIAVRVRGTPAAGEVEKSLHLPTGPAHVIAVEELPGDVIIVRDPDGRETAMRLDPSDLWTRPGSRQFSSAIVESKLATHPNPIARFVWPVSERSPTKEPTRLFPRSPSFQFRTSDELKYLIAHIGHTAAEPRQFADAVAVAGIQAIQVSRPRAVLLILGNSSQDSSQLVPAQTREYLQAIGVPLYVWSLGHLDSDRGWGSVVEITTLRDFRKAFEAVQSDLESQRIVWIQGDHLPPEVESAADDVETLAKVHAERNEASPVAPR